MALSYRCIWQDGFVQFHPFRWGTSRNASPAGDNIWFTDPAEKGWSGHSDDFQYFGNYRDAYHVTFHYRIGSADIFDQPGVLDSPAGPVFRRTLNFASGAQDLLLRAATVPAESANTWLATIQSKAGEIDQLQVDEMGAIWIPAPEENGPRMVFSLWHGDASNRQEALTAIEGTPFPEPMRARDQARPLWPERLHVPGTIGSAIGEAAYAVDTLNVPYDNPWNVVMQMSGIGFLPDGTALASTLSGDVWKISGIDDSLENITWKRYATGFNQPLGIHIDEDGVFVLDRGQITRLHDLNGDDEADFYEIYANDFGGYNRSHSHTFGLTRTADGAFTFVQREEILRTSPERKTSRLAWGVRNCMGVGGSDGWGDYAARDGCLHRVRYTGKALRKPTGFQVHENGLHIDFPIALDPAAASNVSNYFVHKWNYEYASRYGSPEFSQRHPESLGHDPVAVRSCTLLNEGRSIFLEIPMLEPVMQMHVRMHLKDADGTDFATDLFPSILHLGERIENPNFAQLVVGKPTTIALRIRRDKDAVSGDSQSGIAAANEQTVTINAIGGLQYEQKAFSVKAGQAIALKLVNKDVMPHNLVIVKPGTEKEVGDASFAMLNDPDAGAKHYIPQSDNIIAHTFVINPNTTHTLHFTAPSELGTYPYMCTFPGHWMAMRGIMTVE
jgi:azurin